MTDERKQKKAAQAIQALLELDGIKTTVKDVSEKIEGENLTNLVELKDKISNDMRTAEDSTDKTSASDRRRVIGDFVVTNWDLIKGNSIVKDALLNSYCMGRYKKEQREVMAQELLDRVGGTVEKKPVKTKKDKKTEQVAKAEVATDKVEMATAKVESDAEVSNHRQYTF